MFPRTSMSKLIFPTPPKPSSQHAQFIEIPYILFGQCIHPFSIDNKLSEVE